MLLVGCKSTGSSGDEAATNGSSSDTAPATGPSPGVTADSVKIGITYLDLSSIKEITKLDLGDNKAAYQALIDDVNAKGGVNGRMIEPIYQPVSPIGETSANEACVKLTEDDPVFLTMGFFQADQVLCYVDTHATAAIGGTITPERQAKAKAPWYSPEPSAGLEADAIRAFAADGALDGTLGVVATIQGEPNLRAEVLPLLDELDIAYADVGVIDAPDNDSAAQNAAVASIAERFRSDGIDKVLLTGESGLTWAAGIQQSTYRPEMVFSIVNSIRAYTESNDATRDLSMFDGAVAGGLYEAPSDQLPSDDLAKDCFAIQEAAGLKILPADDVPEGDPIQIAASSTACINVALLVHLLEASGPDLNYGTLAQAGEKMGPIMLPTAPDPITFGPGDAADGNPTVYIWAWDPAKQTFAVKT
jgi:hypothetical protein